MMMGFEYKLRFADPSWYQTNLDRVAERIRDLPRLRNELPSLEFRLKDDAIENSWPYDLRIFLRPKSVDLEVSATSASFREDIRALVEWIRL
jgi:hypothetical protein